MEKSLNPLLIFLVIFISWLSLGSGSIEVNVVSGLWDWLNSIDNNDALIIGEIRLPRTLLALVVGAAMGLSGAALQGLLRNPLVDPGLIGASQGAALGAACVFYFNLFSGLGALATPLAGLIGAAITLFILLGLSGSIVRPSIIIMAGLALSMFTGALLAMVLNFAPNPYAMQELVFWLLGSVSNRGLDNLLVLLPAFLIGGGIIWSQRRLLMGLSLGDQVAESMGLQVSRGSRFIILGTAMLVGSAVAVAGNIGFVGLLVPHILRPLVKYRPDKLLLPSALAGAIVVCAADILVRLLPPGRELKLGVLTAVVGAPFFIWLIWKERQRWL
ncbi:MAG: iron ABC transporter permease [Gammaproteobacteria bacterium]|jgi:iron complex transport system permease protein|nr:iron ABC transporter permease [Gammaproteobacteria bacterium]MBT7045422.1 iron ABC transporter permease [Gammaproteobacteria bacterium]